ncbi:acetyltransferase [Neobacillus sp. NRS-1170]|uniref:acetyltransferase n=1 Tax=Neobacillus sp. NRS-1170 TaxID=3233898 RepID=UPI003D2E1513
MKRLLIVGAGGFGNEVLFWAEQIQKENILWEEIAFIDDNPDALNGLSIDNKVVSSIEEFEPQKEDYLVCAIGNPKDKLRICNQLLQKGAKFTNLIHPTAVVAENAVLGTGVILAPYSIVSNNSTIGDFVTLMSFSIIGHDAKVGSGCTICDHCNVMGNVSIEDSVFLGGSAAVLPSIHIQNNAIVGAGSVVTRKVKENTTVFGNPAVKVI